MRLYDFHAHSTFSDGTDTPAELVRQARKAGVRALALTDHDNTGGAASFLEACRHERITGIVGVEISVQVPAGTLHMLGFGVDPHHAALNEALSRVLDGRDWRNRRILERLNALGLALSWEEIAVHAGEDVVGRPHFAAAMLARGHVSTRQQAFDDYLAKGAAAYVDRFRIEPLEGIRLILAAGGAPVLAHPFTWQPEISSLAAQLAVLKSGGLVGIEAYYPEHTPQMTVDYLRLAMRLDLLVTGGSDYHGSTRPEVKLGRGTGSLAVPESVLPPLLAAIRTPASIHEEAAT